MIDNMKRLIVIAALLSMTVLSFAQKLDISMRPRMEIAEVENEKTNEEFEVFYMNDENPRVYYLSVGHLGVGNDIVQLQFDPIYELFIPLGENLSDAIAKMEEMKKWYKNMDMEPVEIQGCLSAAYPTDEMITVTVRPRKFMLSNMLQFSIPTAGGDLIRAAYLTKGEFSGLLTGLKIHKKLHPKD